MHAISYEPCMVGFWNFIPGIWIPHEKIADPYAFLVQVISLSGVMPFEKIRMESCQQDISKSIWARRLKLNQLIGDDK